MSVRIKFGDPVEPTLPEEKLPPAEMLVYHSDNEQLQSESFQVYILASVLEQIGRHLRENRRVEAGGVLVGHPFRDIDNPEITFVVITGAIRQDSDNRSVGHFTVGPAEINAARLEMEREYPGLVAVGWYHSHPGHGVFLSAQDMIIVKSIYNANWHIALVIDPQRKEIGFFRGPQGELLSGWLELKGQEPPIFIKAVGKYNYVQELLAQGKTERARQELIELGKMINNPAMIHWQERDGYLDTRRILNRLPVNGQSSNSAEHTTMQLDTPDKITKDDTPDDLMKFAARYQEAKKLVQDAIPSKQNIDFKQLREAQQILQWLHQESPAYEDIEFLLNITNHFLSNENPQRAAAGQSFIDALRARFF